MHPFCCCNILHGLKKNCRCLSHPSHEKDTWPDAGQIMIVTKAEWIPVTQLLLTINFFFFFKSNLRNKWLLKFNLQHNIFGTPPCPTKIIKHLNTLFLPTLKSQSCTLFHFVWLFVCLKIFIGNYLHSQILARIIWPYFFHHINHSAGNGQSTLWTSRGEWMEWTVHCMVLTFSKERCNSDRKVTELLNSSLREKLSMPS